MKQILITAATQGELNIIKQECKKYKILGCKVNYLLLGIGNYSTVYILSKEQLGKKYNLIINIGICGYIENLSNNIFQVSRITNISNNKELLVPVFLKFAKLESIACSEKVCYSDTELLGENYVDMESYGFEFVCEKYAIPRLLLKIPVDRIGDETRNFDFQKAKRLLAENIDYSKLLDSVGKYLNNSDVGAAGLQSLHDIQKYYDYYNMTVSEKIIFQKFYNKYQALIEDEGGETFDTFFENNKLLCKKDFFSDLQLT